MCTGVLGEETRLFDGAPLLIVKPDGAPHRRTAQRIDSDKSEYADVRVILMVRDPRDAAVSNFFQVTRREATFKGDLAAWLTHPTGSVASMLRYYAVWARQRHVPR